MGADTAVGCLIRGSCACWQFLELDKKQQFTKGIYSSTDRLGKNVLKWLRLGLDS